MPNVLELASLATEVVVKELPGVARAISESTPTWETLARESLGIMPKEFSELKLGSRTSIGKIIEGSTTKETTDFFTAAKKIENPYLSEFNALQENPDYQLALDVARFRKWSDKLTPATAYIKQDEMRRALTDKYSWSVPNSEALALTAEQGPLVDAGAGSGYWAHLLQNMGADVVAFDKHGVNTAENYYASRTDKAWTHIIKGGVETMARYPNRTLFLSFPPHEEPFGADVLKTYGGNKFVFIGETWRLFQMLCIDVKLGGVLLFDTINKFNSLN